MQPQPLTQAELDRLTDDQLSVLARATQRLADVSQRTAAGYQRQADRLRKALKARHKRGEGRA